MNTPAPVTDSGVPGVDVPMPKYPDVLLTERKEVSSTVVPVDG